MTEIVFAHQLNFRVVTCCNCHMAFGMPDAFYDKRRADRRIFTCPAGHEQHFTGPTEESKLRDEVVRQRSVLEAAQARATRLQHERDVVSKAHRRMRERIQNGVCPCCNRTFQNLLQHMTSEHGDRPTVRLVRQAYGLTQESLAAEIGVKGAHISLAERGAPVPKYAGDAIEAWVTRQAPSTSATKEKNHG
jgi:DNA-binding XRE family transcriptional regulator